MSNKRRLHRRLLWPGRDVLRLETCARKKNHTKVAPFSRSFAPPLPPCLLENAIPHRYAGNNLATLLAGGLLLRNRQSNTGLPCDARLEISTHGTRGFSHPCPEGKEFGGQEI